MKRSIQYLSVVLVLFIFSFIFSDNIIAQKNAKRNYDNNYEKGLSLKSSPTKVEIRNNNYERDYSDRYEKRNRKDTDSYKRNDKNLRDYKHESSENYFRIDKSKNSLWDGKHWEETKFPLNIYIRESSSKYYESTYKDYVKYALDIWRKADDRIQYKFVKSIADADIAIIFVENLGNKYEENYLGLTDYETDRNKQIEFSKIQISLIKNGNEKISAGEIKATIIHEFGHSFGLGHSDNENDLMYPYISPEHDSEMTYDEISIGDKLAIKEVINLCFEKNYVLK